MSFIYILESETSGKLYLGYTTDLEQRVEEHNHGIGQRWTKGKGPWTLKYSEAFEEDTDARKRELELKRKKSSVYLRWLIANGPGSTVG